jgi:hypothetical protein
MSIPNQDVERPDCACHGEPQIWVRSNRAGLAAGGWWACGVKRREQGRARYRRDPYVFAARMKARRDNLRAQGLCVQCGKDVAITGTLCFVCAGKRDEWNAARLT